MNELDNLEEEKRPVFLKVLAILSFITIGLGILGSLGGFLSGKLSPEQMEDVMAKSSVQISTFQDAGMDNFADIFRQMYKMQEYINANFFLHNFLTLLTLILGLFGVIYMMKGIKKGFHMYILYNILNLLVVYASVPVAEVPNFMIVTNLIISALFIFLYSRNLHWMTK